jgi:hypothetical protein
MSCVVCSDDQPCLFDVLADPGAAICLLADEFSG